MQCCILPPCNKYCRCLSPSAVYDCQREQKSTSNPQPKLCCWLMIDASLLLLCCVSALIHANVSFLTVCRLHARAPLFWAHAAPAVPAAPCKPFIPGGKTLRSHTDWSFRVKCLLKKVYHQQVSSPQNQQILLKHLDWNFLKHYRNHKWSYSRTLLSI